MIKSRSYSSPEVLAKIAGLNLRARRVVEGTISGLHRSPFHGFNVEFADYREYSPGDDLRRLDWRALGRSDRFYIKQYEEESNLRATLLLDTSASMRYGNGPLNKFDFAATLTAALAHMLILQQDPVGLALFAKTHQTYLRPAATQAQYAQIIDALEAAEPSGETELGDVLAALSDQIHRRGLVVIVSDLLTDWDGWINGLSRLRHRGHEILIFHILDRDELELPFRDLTLFRDLEGSEELFADPSTFRKAYTEAMGKFIADARYECGRLGVDHVLMRTDQDVGDTLCQYLHLRGRTSRKMKTQGNAG
jgi:uncharacterized protein (DUF58 family)